MEDECERAPVHRSSADQQHRWPFTNDEALACAHYVRTVRRLETLLAGENVPCLRPRVSMHRRLRARWDYTLDVVSRVGASRCYGERPDAGDARTCRRAPRRVGKREE